MKSERLQILSLAYTGQLAQEEADLRLAILGKRERRVFRLILTVATVAAMAAIIVIFHLEDKVRMIAQAAFSNLEGITIFREIYVFCRHILDIL